MLSHRQGLAQRQSLQQKLSPQQIQYIKMLQMTTQAMEHRIKEEMELNPTLEDSDDERYDESNEQQDDYTEKSDDSSETADDKEVDWDSYHSDSDDAYQPTGSWNPDKDDLRDLPTPYEETQLEKLESQVMMLNLSEKQQLIADQILGSIEEDGYFRRDLTAVADGVAFQSGVPIKREEAEAVLQMIQRLDPPGIGARNLRECLLIQLDLLKHEVEGRDTALEIIRYHWDDFEKKHFERIIKRMNIDEETFKKGYECMLMLDPKPGSFESAAINAGNYITPDFEVYFQPESDDDSDDAAGEFIITLHRRNLPDLRVSSRYERMLKELDSSSKKDQNTQQTRAFIKEKIESARSFMDMIRQRKDTLMNVMRTIVALQERFFKSGKDIKPMILKNIADRVHLDVSTISRVVNGKYVQTPFGVFELRYFFNEGITTDSGEDVSNLEVKKLLAEIIDNEPKNKPYSDEKLAEELNKQGFQLARRTVTKYREQMKYPPARLRKMLI